MTTAMMTTDETVDYFDDLQPDDDLTLDDALANPVPVSWSYWLDGKCYSCRSWSEVCEVAEEGLAKAAETWHALMPELPLERHTPIVFPSACKGTIVKVGTGEREGQYVVWDGLTAPAWRSPGRRSPSNLPFLRVDLDHPQGQRYAVNVWLDGQPGGVSPEYGRPHVVRLMRGKGAESDKLWLAKALDEVAR